MKKSILLLGLGWSLHAWAGSCEQWPASWTINDPIFQERQEPVDFIGRRSHVWGTTKHMMDVAVQVTYRRQQGCFIPEVTLDTRDYLLIRYKKEVDRNSCLKRYILQHEARHAEYARQARRQLITVLRQTFPLTGQYYKSTPMMINAVKKDILAAIPSALAGVSDSPNHQLDEKEAITPEMLHRCQWKE